MRRTTACFLALALAGSMFAPNTVAAADPLTVSRLFDDDGGTLVATGADGTQFVLTVPPDALGIPMNIAMTPLKGRFPWEGRAEVRIEPEGAFLWQPADLKIVPPTPTDVNVLRTFRVGAPDGSFTSYPMVPGSTDVEMSISFLSTYGYLTDATSSMPQMSHRVGPSGVRKVLASDATVAALSPYIAQQADILRRARAQDTPNGEYNPELWALWADAWKLVVSPAVSSLGSDCELGQVTAITELGLEFLHLDLTSADPNQESYRESTFDVIQNVLTACVDVFYQRCKERNDPTQVLFIYQAARQLLLIGKMDTDGFLEVQDKVAKCLLFEVDFESALTVGTSVGGGLITDHMKLRAIVPLQLEYIREGDRQRIRLAGKGQIQYTFIDLQGSPCTYKATTTPDTFVVSDLTMVLFSLNENGNSNALQRDEILLDMIYQPGYPEESFIQTCPAGSAGTITVNYPPEPIFPTFYGFLHEEEANGPGEYEIRTPDAEAGAASYVPGQGTPTAGATWELIRSGSFFAKAQYVRSRFFPGLGSIPEETYIFLKHVPQ